MIYTINLNISLNIQYISFLQIKYKRRRINNYNNYIIIIIVNNNNINNKIILFMFKDIFYFVKKNK